MSLTGSDSISYGIAGFVPNLSGAASSDDIHRVAVCPVHHLLLDRTHIIRISSESTGASFGHLALCIKARRITSIKPQHLQLNMSNRPALVVHSPMFGPTLSTWPSSFSAALVRFDVSHEPITHLCPSFPHGSDCEGYMPLLPESNWFLCPRAQNPFYGHVAGMGEGYLGGSGGVYPAPSQLRNPVSAMAQGLKTLSTPRPAETIVSNGMCSCNETVSNVLGFAEANESSDA